MERFEMLKKAVKLAHETVDGVAYLADATYGKVKEFPDEQAIHNLAQTILEDAWVTI